MGQQLSQLISLAISLLFGALLGAVVVWLILRKHSEAARTQAKSEGQTEIVRLNERVSAVTEDLGQHRARLNESETKATELRSQLDVMRDERTRLEERASRVPALEAEHKADLEALESLRSRLQEETNRSATLTEQCARLPEVEKALNAATAEKAQINQQLADLREKLGGLESTLAGQEQQIGHLESERSELAAKRDELAAAQEDRMTQLATLTAELDAERKQSVEKLALLNEAKEQLTNQFKSLANEILEEKATRFTEQNKINIGQILEPLKTKIQEFQGKVEEVYVQEGRDRTALAEQVKQLMSLNQQLSQDAHNLTQALKGSSKTQGNWGELILERVLEASGLRKGHEYDVRESYTREDGSRAQPDVVIRLPESKHLVVDSKVSLTAYEEYSNAENEAAREAATARHLDSVRAHIKELSEKNYQALYDLNSLDFTVMFIPIEPAFMLAIANENRVWEDAWKKNVLMVSPSTLLFVLRTVAYLWRQEQQNRNVQEIAKRGADLYDKLVGFVEDLNKIGERLTQAKDSYDSAYGKFSRGRGNVIRQAEMLRDLGVKPSKSLPNELVEASADVPLVLPSAGKGGETTGMG